MIDLTTPEIQAIRQQFKDNNQAQKVALQNAPKLSKPRLSKEEKNFLTQIFRFFTQGDIDVAGGYVKNYLPYFKQPEVRMMLLGFAAREALHIAAYSHLIETLGLPESTYNQFLEYQEMRDKHEYVLDISSKNGTLESTATHIAVFSAFTEGMQLFSSFIMLLNFPRHGLMKGMGQIVTWSIVDETMHAENMIKLFKEFIKEPGVKRFKGLRNPLNKSFTFLFNSTS